MTHWFEVYDQLALVLDNFYGIHKEEAGRILFEKCTSSKEFLSANSWIKKFQDKLYDDVQGIDPIHVFASLNESRVKKDVRIKRINIFLKILSSPIIEDEIDFKGCPSPFTIKIMGVRKDEVQREIWKTFHELFNDKREALNQDVFSRFKNWYGVDIKSFTIFLYWIDSNNFLPLDNNTIQLLMGGGKIDTIPVSYQDYLNILTNVPQSLYRDLTAVAYEIVHSKTNEKVKSQRIHYYFQNKGDDKAFKKNDFKIIAIRPKEKLRKKFKKILDTNETYKFYAAYDFLDNGDIKYDEGKDVKLYNINRGDTILNVNVSALVGKNGSGKSSISDLLFLVINNLSERIFRKESDLEYVSDIEVELFYSTDSIYKVIIKEQTVSWFKYSTLDGKLFSRPDPVSLEKKSLSSFFYLIAVNYSHYGLNSLEIGTWINGLFHKNDGYQVPIVINPMRKKGNIDVNTEKDLLYSRLLANLLEPGEELRKITDSKSATHLKLSLNHEKLKFLYDEESFPPDVYQDQILSTVFLFFEIPEAREGGDSTTYAKKYIYRKLVSISRKYIKYWKYYKEDTGQFDMNEFGEYLSLLQADSSHITNKLRQAINFLKFPHLKYRNIDKAIDIEALSNDIESVISENLSIIELRTIELIPPPFFKVEILLDNDSAFDELSSGEKQRIYVVSSLVYHLVNLNSISSGSDLVKYGNINILFDEVELYFHPEMQRTFIDYLLKYLQKVEINDITSLNLCFITHSPLILSDIPDTNILFLTEKGLPLTEEGKIKTFGGNIHDLLAESFFLGNGFIGDFARNKIQQTIDLLNVKDANETKETEIKSIIEMIGEPYLKEEMERMFYEKFPESYKKQKQIEELEARLRQLKG